jgi:hypothetical protein
LLKGVAWLLFVIAGLAFCVGGRAISEFAHADRILAELVGLVIAGLCAVLGVLAKTAGENLGEPEQNKDARISVKGSEDDTT